MEFIKEFQDFMNEAIDRLLKKPAREHPHWKDKPEPHMEQGKHKEAIHKEAEHFHQETSAENLTTSETVELCWRQWIQTNVSRN